MISSLRMLTVTLLVCAMMAMATAEDEQDAHINQTTVDAANNTRAGCPQGWTPYDGRCFQFVPTQMTWAAAEQNCLTLKATLASIHNKEEHEFLQSMTTATQLPTWIGASDCQEENFWFWTDSTNKDFTSWCPAQPDGKLAECCLQMNTGGGKCWDDVACGNVNPSICVLK